jgi:hypothetical protein
MNNIRFEASRQISNKTKEYLKDKINELGTSSKNITDLCRGKNEFKTDCQPKSYLVKNQIGDLLVDSHTRWKNYSHLPNKHWVSDVRQKEIHTDEPLEPDTFDVEIVITKAEKV